MSYKEEGALFSHVMQVSIQKAKLFLSFLLFFSIQKLEE